MKRSLFLILTILLCLSCEKDPSNADYDFPLSQKDAVNVVRSFINKYQDRSYFVSKNIIKASSTLEYSELGGPSDHYDTIKSPDFDAWLIVIGPDQHVNGPYEQIHLFVNVNNAKYEQIKIEGRVIVEWDTSYDAYSKANAADYDNNLTKSPQTSLSSSSSSGIQKWAVIISGGYTASSNYARYWYDCQNVYTALTANYNYDDSHIVCIVSDGTSSGLDRCVGPNAYDSSPLDFDGDGDNDINFSATKANISAVFNNLATLISSDDELVVFVTDHGSSDGRIYLWGGEMLSPAELNAELDKINSSAKIDVVLGQCYSGSFIPTISADNRTVATACTSSEMSYGNGYLYDYFLYYWTLAFTSSRNLADTNNNGIVSFEEAFNYSRDNDPYYAGGYEHPQYCSSPVTFGSGHDICGHELSFSGDDYVSTQYNSTYTISGLTSTATTSWALSSNLSLVSSTSTSVTVSGHITSGYYSPTATISASFTCDGQPYTIKRKITSVWKPGSYSHLGYITGSNGSYMVTQCPGAYSYFWMSDNSAWQILSQGSFQVSVHEGSTSSPVDLTVGFLDPLGETILITDRVKN